MSDNELKSTEEIAAPEKTAEPVKGNPQKPAQGSKQRKTTFICAAVMFGIMLILILYSYLIQQRNENALEDLSAQHSSFSVNAIENIANLQEENTSLLEENSGLRKKLGDLENRQAELESSNTELQQRLAGETRARENEIDALSKLLEIVRLEGADKLEDARRLLAQIEDEGISQYFSDAADELYGEIKTALEPADADMKTGK